MALTNDVTLGELLDLQRSIPRGGSSFYVDSSLLVRMLAELVRIRTAAEPPAPHIEEPFTVSELQVERICTAYESGYGRGQSKRDLSQPYRAGCAEAFAYYKGWLRGCQHQNRGEKP